MNKYIVNYTLTLGNGLIIDAMNADDAKTQVIKMIENGQIDCKKMMIMNRSVNVIADNCKENDKITFF